MDNFQEPRAAARLPNASSYPQILRKRQKKHVHTNYVPYRLGAGRLRPHPRILLLLAFLISFAHGAQTYWVTANGDNSNNGTSESDGWASLKYACSQVSANQDNTIKLGVGTFLDPDRLTGNGSPAILPKGVNLVGSGRTQTIYKGEIRVPNPDNQTIKAFHLDGRENTTAAATKFSGLIIQSSTNNSQASNVHVQDMRIEGFYGMGLQFGYWDGLKDSSLHDCELVNNGAHNKRGFGMRTGNLFNTDIYNNTFLEERGKGGEPWNSGERLFTNSKIYNNTFKITSSTAGGWQGQAPFNFELFKVDCLNVEVFNNRFDGSISLVDKNNHRSNRQPFGIRVYNNRWDFTNRYCIEVAMDDMVIDHNYFHFGLTQDKEDGGGAYALSAYGSVSNNLQIHHNVFDGVKFEAIHGVSGNNIGIYNNTVTGSRPGESEGSSTPYFIVPGDVKTNWDIVNNVFRCDSTRQGKFINQSGSGYSMPGLRCLSNAIYNAESGLNSTILANSDVNAPAVLNPRMIEYGAKPDPFFALSPDSPLIDSGSSISGITDGYLGSAPDIGAIEGATSHNAPLLPLGSELVANGGFEAPDSDSEAGFNQTEGIPEWASVGSTTQLVGNTSANPAEGNWSGRIYLGGWNSRALGQTTAHVIRSGDEFELSFKHNILSAWNPRLSARVFYEENGKRITISEWTDSYDWYSNRGSNNNNSTQPWRTQTISGITVPAAAVKRPIGVMFTNKISSQFVRVDSVSLKRTAGPESDPEAGSHAVTLTIDEHATNGNLWNYFDFGVTNNSSSSAIDTIELTLQGGAVWDYFASENGYTVSPDVGAGSESAGNVPNVTLTFGGGGLAAGASVSDSNTSNDIDGSAPTGITAIVTFKDGTTLTGAFVNIGDSDDGDSALWQAQMMGGESSAPLNLGTLAQTSYSDQDKAGSTTLGSGGSSVTLTGNNWKKFALPLNITASTVLEVTVNSSDTGEIVAIGFDSDNDHDNSQTFFQIGGSQQWNNATPITPNYTAGEGAVTYVIPVGAYFTGNMGFLTLIADDDGNASANVTFSNIRVD